MLTSAILARSLSVEHFGQIGIASAVLQFVTPCIVFNALGLVAINKVKLEKKSFQEFSNNYFTVAGILTIVSFTAGQILGGIYPAYGEVAYIIPILSFVMAFNEFQNAELIQESKSLYYGLYIFITRFVTILFVVTAVYALNYPWYAYFYALLVGELVSLIVRYKYHFNILRNFRISFDKKEFYEILKYGLPLFFLLIAGWSLNSIDRFIVLKYFSLKEVAYYTLAYQLGMSINLANTALTNSVVPIIYNAIHNNENSLRLINKYIAIYSSVIVAVILVASISFTYLIPIVFGKSYHESIRISIFIAIAFGFVGVYRIPVLVIDFYKKNSLKTTLTIIAAVLNLVFSLYFIRDFGVMAPAYGTLLSYFLLALACYYYAYKELR